MPTPSISGLTRLGIDAARKGDNERAAGFLKEAVNANEKDLVAWWWLARVLDDPAISHKCLEKCRQIAAENEEGAQAYRRLMEESGASRLMLYKTAAGSRSAGDQCPTCTLRIAAGEEIVICPGCRRPSHSECWEGNVFHCGNYGCNGSALLDRTRPPEMETSAKDEPIRLEDAEIPTTGPQESRTDQEEGFVRRLQERAVETILWQAMQRAEAEKLEKQEREARIKQLRAELSRRTNKALIAGLVLGICLAVPAFQTSGNWLLALLTLYFTVSGARAAALYSFTDPKQLASVLYWLLPQAASAFLMWVSFAVWNLTVVPAVFAIATMLITARVLKITFFHERRAFIGYSGWLLLVLALLRIALS